MNSQSPTPPTPIQNTPAVTAQSETVPKNETSSTERTPQRDSPIPSEQQSFTAMIDSFIPKYNSADTEVRKTSVKFERKDAIVKYFDGPEGLQFQGWVGEVNGLKTESDGKAYISVKLRGSRTALETWNNSLSDSSDNTMISGSDPIYQSLMDVKEGDVVMVSGTFLLSSSRPDYVREASLTEEGSMTSPEFVVRFSQITKR